MFSIDSSHLRAELIFKSFALSQTNPTLFVKGDIFPAPNNATLHAHMQEDMQEDKPTKKVAVVGGGLVRKIAYAIFLLKLVSLRAVVLF